MKFGNLSAHDKQIIVEGVLEEIRNCILKDIVLFETGRGVSERYRAFRLHFPEGSFDMVVYDKEQNQCTVFEIIDEMEVQQKNYKNLIDDAKINELEKRYGKITTKYILYRGEDYFEDDKIVYMNVENYLKSL